MWTPLVYAVSVCSARTISASPLNPLNILNPQAGTSISQEKPSLQLNQTSLSTVASTNTSLGIGDYQCDANAYGNVEYRDCQDAFGLIGMDQTLHKIADRGLRGAHYASPYRYTAGNGRCVIDVEIASDVKEVSITEFGIHFAAYSLINKCVGPRGSGGKVSNLGQESKISVTIRSFGPRLRCQTPSTTLPPLEACKDIVSIMRVTPDLVNFGPFGAPGVQIGVPSKKIDHTGQCAIILELDILAEQRYQRVSWYDIWQQAESLLGTCLREGQGGFAAVRGQTPGRQGNVLVSFRRPKAVGIGFNITSSDGGGDFSIA